MVKLTVAGRINDGSFWRARRAALRILADDAELEVDLKPLLPVDYDLFLEKARKVLRGAAWHHQEGVIAYLDSDAGYVGGAAAVTKLVWQRARYVDTETDADYEKYALDMYRTYVAESSEVFAELALEIEGAPMGSLVFRVDPETAPRTCEHFMSLLDAPTVPGSSALLGSAWHRVAPGGFAQGGVLSQERGAVWEKARAAAGTDDVLVADESFATLHDASGVLGFANSGPHTIGTQIYVTFAPMPTLDRKYVAFGKLVDGLSVLRALEGVETVNEVPSRAVTIAAARLYTP